MDDGDVADAAGDLGSFGGKVLRLNPDGTTPADQEGGTPVFALNVNRPSGMDWGSDGALWIVESGLLQVVVADTRRERRGRTIARYSLPEGTGASALSFYHANLIPAFQGNLFIAGSGDRTILRLQFDRKRPMQVVSTERLVLEAFDTVRCDRHRERGRDLLLHLECPDEDRVPNRTSIERRTEHRPRTPNG